MGWYEDFIDEEWDQAEAEYLEQPKIRLNKGFLANLKKEEDKKEEDNG